MTDSRNFARPEYYRLAPDEIEAKLEALGLARRDFARLTGVDVQNVRRWLLPEGDERSIEPPFWVSSWLAMAAVPGALDAARSVAADNLITGESDDAT